MASNNASGNGRSASPGALCEIWERARAYGCSSVKRHGPKSTDACALCIAAIVMAPLTSDDLHPAA